MKATSLEKDRIKALGELLVSEVKNDGCSTGTLQQIIDSGADVCYAYAKPLKFAAKLLKFDVVLFLMQQGASSVPFSFKYIAQMCESKGFAAADEPRYFALVEYCLSLGAEKEHMLVEYINRAFVNGNMDALTRIMQQFGFSPKEVANLIYVRIIFESILAAQDEALAFISQYREWMTQESFDLAVHSGDWIAVEYFLNHSPFKTPNLSAVANALYHGNFEVLDMLISVGYSFNKSPFLLKKACSAAYGGDVTVLEYLFKRGYSPSDRYDSRSLRENAVLDKNVPLLKLLDSIKQKEIE